MTDQVTKRMGRTGFYRLRQFWKGWLAALTPAEVSAALVYLPAAAQGRFRTLPTDAQRHSLNVLQTLQARGPVDNQLAAAALLHDIGKLAADQAGVHINLWVRGPLVVFEKVAPQLLTRWASADVTHGWRYLLYVHLMHPTIGAQWAKEWGCTPLTCWLIEHHQDQLTAAPVTEAEQSLVLLQWADNRN